MGMDTLRLIGQPDDMKDTCERCGGTGRFAYGRCYACGGKGRMTDADRVRRARRKAHAARVQYSLPLWT